MLTSGYLSSHPGRLPLEPEAVLERCTGAAMPQIAASEYEIVGSSPAMARLRLQVRRVGPHFRTVLLRGEAGTGKELAARALHGMSQGARQGPFVVCCAADLDEAAATGSWRDTLTMAADRMEQMVESARGGTLFFDQIGKMPLALQGQLLKIMRRQEWVQRGLAAPQQKMDLRLIASTQEDLRAQASAGRFSQELYRQLAMVEIALPPLRERTEDIPELAVHFLERLSAAEGKGAGRITREATGQLKAYCWPGNVRELQGVLREAISRCAGAIVEAHHLPLLADEDDNEPSGEGATTPRLQDVVEQHVLQVLKSCGGNKLRAAELLGISRSTLYRMLDACTPSNG